MSNLYAWAGKLLFVDLSSGHTETRDTEPYAATLIGGRSLACKIGWDELPEGTAALDPENILMITTGPLTGTSAPFSGRTTISGLSPQGWPHEWFSRSGLGGHWGPAIKYAGFDGIFIRGKASEPVYLWIDDGRVEVRSARDLWGCGIFETQERLIEKHGNWTRILAIGQAGEHLSRIAIISTETESSAGQGGFGAVMGSKKLKAIAVRGSGALRIAEPEEFIRKSRAIAKEAHASHSWPAPPSLDPKLQERYGQKWHACTQQCSVLCAGARYYTHVPGPVTGRVCRGQLHCVANLFPGIADTFYDWDLGFEAGFEISTFSDDWGINHWDIILGIMPWLRACVEAGYLTDVDGLEFNLNDPHFWWELLRRITFREGIGDVLAEGGRRAPALLGLGEDIAASLYTAWGCAGHWDGHGDRINNIVFPYWLVAALQWAVDVRDPISSGHGYAANVMNWSPIVSPEHGLSWEQIKYVGQHVYGSSLATDPESGYAYKAEPAVWHSNRSMLKDSLTADDQMYPRLFSKRTEDGYARTDGMEGPDFEWHLFTAATGLAMSRTQLDRCGERGINLERALQIRHFGRSRRDDENVIPFFETEEYLANPFLGEKQSLDRQKFLGLIDRFYELRGWDRHTGWPTRAKLLELGLDEVADQLSPENKSVERHKRTDQR